MRSCHSSLRMRSVMRALSLELYGKSIAVPEFPVDKSIRGLGMSDWEGYARRLEEKFSYVNTYYHAEPRLDITRIAHDAAGRYRFLISSDVFEHIRCFGWTARFATRAAPGRLGAPSSSVPVPESGERRSTPADQRLSYRPRKGKRFLRNGRRRREETSGISSSTAAKG